LVAQQTASPCRCVLLAGEQVYIQLPAYADSVALVTFIRRTPLLLNAGHAAINSCQPSSQQQTHSSGFAAMSPFWERQTDRRTHTMRAVPITINDERASSSTQLSPLKLSVSGLIHARGSLGPRESTPRTASRSVQPLLQDSRS